MQNRSNRFGFAVFSWKGRRSQKSKVRSRKSEVGSQKSELGSQKSQLGSQKSDLGSQKWPSSAIVVSYIRKGRRVLLKQL
jgi:hypothetical protein